MTVEHPELPPEGESESPTEAERYGYELKAFCDLGMQAELLTGIFINILRNKFAKADYLLNPTLRSLLWKQNPPTGILVESSGLWDPTKTEGRPAVIVKRNSYRNYRLGIGDRIGSDAQGDERFTSFWVGSHTLFCLRDGELPSALLGGEVRDSLMAMGPVIRKDLNLRLYQVQEYGATARIAGCKHVTFGTPVTIGIAYEHSWTVETESLPLAKISLSVLING